MTGRPETRKEAYDKYLRWDVLDETFDGRSEAGGGTLGVRCPAIKRSCRSLSQPETHEFRRAHYWRRRPPR